MPIRTPRGRSAAYRGIWQWPLRSPARLAVTVAVLVVIAAGFGFAGGLRAPRNGDSGPLYSSPTSSTGVPIAVDGSTTPTPTELPPVPELTPTTLPVSKAPAAALDVARRWARAWLRPADGTTAQQWLDGLRPLTTDEYLGVLSSVDPANIPSTAITGPIRAVAVSPQSVRVEVPTDAAKLIVVVVDDAPAGWRVADYDEG